MQRYNYMTNQFEIRRKWASSPMHVFVRQYMRLQFNRQSDESYQENKTRISSAVMRTNVAIERHASKVYTRKMFEQFGENLFEGGSYRVEEIEKTKEKYRRTA